MFLPTQRRVFIRRHVPTEVDQPDAVISGFDTEILLGLFVSHDARELVFHTLPRFLSHTSRPPVCDGAWGKYRLQMFLR